MAIKVKNQKSKEQFKCNCGSWLAHWEKFSYNKAEYCSVVSCLSKDLVGAQVINFDSADDNVYIIPLCKMHSESSEVLEIMRITFISSNVKVTCGK